MRRLWIGIGLVVIIVIVSIAILLQTQKEPKEKEIVIGAILPLTGSASLLGTETKQGIDIALEEVNKNNLIPNRKIRVIYQDSMNDPKEGVSAFQLITTTEKPSAVIVSMSSVTKAIIPLADQKKIVVFATVTAAPEITEPSQWAFRYYYTTDVQGEALAKFINDKLQLKNISVLYLNDDYGVTGYESLRKELEERGIKITAAESYNKLDTEIRTQITKVGYTHPEGIVVIAYDNPLAIAIKQLKEAGISAKIFSYSGLADPEILQLTGNAADGAYLTISNYDPKNPPTQMQKDFVTKYKDKFGKLPGHYPAFGYDVIMALLEAIKIKGDSPDNVRQGLLAIKNVDFVLGRVNITEKREARFPQVIKMVQNGELVSVE